MTSSLSNTTSDHSVRFLTFPTRKECQRIKQKILHNISTHCSKITVCVPLGSAHWTPSNFTVLIILHHLEHFQLFLKHFIVRQTFSQIRGSERCEDLLFAALKQNTNSLSMFQSRADTTATFPFSDPRQVQHSVSHTHSVLSPTL